MRRYGFQSSCKISNFFLSSHSSFRFGSHYFGQTSLQSDLCSWLWLCVTHIPVSKLCKSKQRTVKVWMNGLGLFGFSGTFSLLLYCRIVLDLLYIFLWGRGLGWHLLQYCDDYLKIVNCTEFTIILFVLSVGIPYKICILCFFFPLRLWKIKLYSSKSLSSPQHCFFFFIFFSRAMIKRNLKTVNKYYCVEIWMSLQKCIWMS